MIDIDALKQVFREKLEKTGSMDEAFTKAVWVAFQAGTASTQAAFIEREACALAMIDARNNAFSRDHNRGLQEAERIIRARK